MQPTEKQINYFRSLIRKGNLMEKWGEGLFVHTTEQKQLRAKKMALEAFESFKRHMTSAKNDGSFEYIEWAALTAIGSEDLPYGSAHATDDDNDNDDGSYGSEQQRETDPIVNEALDYAEDVARSDDEGWFYPDDED